jgi:hypothetical protein
MKKTIICLLIIAVASTCCVTNAMAVPKIIDVRGGYGVSATVVDATNRNWLISIQGPEVFTGMITSGDITSDSEIIRTPLFPPALGIGKITIKVSIFWYIIPVAMEERSAFMIGPFVLLDQ